MADPSDDAIRQVCEFAGLDPFADRQLVISALKANSGNVEAFRQTYAWTESSFTGDRDNTNDNPDVPSFTINATDEPNIIQGVNPSHLKNSSYDGDFPYLESASPSHPPSRATSPGPRNISGWINETNHLNFGAPSTLAQEDEDLERALAESAAMSGIHTPQETGVTGTAAVIGPSAASTSDGAAAAAAYPAIGPQRPDAANKSVEQDSAKPHFGPANRATYNTEDWAMTRIEPSSKDAKPSARIRSPNSPAFLGSIDHNYLNALLTVLHSIPAARNALLRFGGVEAHTYGNNPGWWKSTAIDPVGDLKRGPIDAGETWMNDSDEEVFYPPPSVDRDPNDKTPVATLPLGTNVARQFIEEVQRLMAFLDGTDRSYAYTETLETAHVSTMAEGEDTTRRFCSTLAYFRLADFNDALFTEVKMLRQTRDLQETLTDCYMLLDLNCNGVGAAPDESLPLTSIYHMLDQAFWTYMCADLGPQRVWEIEDYKTATVSRLAPVQTFRVNTSDTMVAPNYRNYPYSLQGVSLEASGLKEPLKTGTYARSHRIEIPETLYMDRYAEENQGWALEQQDKMRMAMLALRRIHAITCEISQSSGSAAPSNLPSNLPSQFTGPLTAAETKATARGAVTDKMSLCKKLSAVAMIKLWNCKAKILWQRSNERHTDFNSADVDAVEPETPEEQRVFGLLRAELAVAQKQMKEYHKRVGQLQAEREAIWKLLTRLRSKRTVPTKEEPLKYKYKLRGVVISSKRFYICRREQVPEDEVINLEDKVQKNEDLINLDESKDNTEEAKEANANANEEKTPPAYREQWWLVMHREESTFVQKASLEVVLSDAQTAGVQVVLTYCTDEAWTTEPEPLSDALKTFVKHDNRHFKTERETERKQALELAAVAQNMSFVENKKRQQGTPVDDYSSLLSPIKRRHQRSSSADSMASNASVRSVGSRVLSVASGNASPGGGVSLKEYEMEDMPLLSRQESAAAKANANMPVASNLSLQQAINKAELDDFNSEASSEGDGFDDGGAYKDAMMQEAVLQSIAESKAEEARRQRQTEEEANQHPAEKEKGKGKEEENEKELVNTRSSPLGKSMVDLVIGPEADAGQPAQEKTPANPSDPVMQEQVRIPKEMQYPKEKDKRQAGETERQFSTGVQLLADWDNPEGRYVPDEMDES
ncbi:ubiquitin interaction domain-containing protein [Ophiostoma piceae UAMH 11346]|uniref:Ubiquitin interaction domain-containing protein n=1 Tax=Ophiostoma piceae (strain UAMH 11346) TaxID=1262450 RepID=S3CGF2_OPHP1|nr:ubiquitin interaction domain-containing protein [Ophiostoma piceae UAMH 11346]